jgi:putative restriction endonuclease
VPRHAWSAFGGKNGVARLSMVSSADELSEEQSRYGTDYLTRARLGQGAFRLLVTEAYEKRCAITGERTLPVLQASHIKPFALQGPNRVSNGLLLRSDLHILFDRGYLTLTPNLHVEVSKRIKEEFENGREYYAHPGRPLAVRPESPMDRPAAEFLRWHNDNVFEKNGLHS